MAELEFADGKRVVDDDLVGPLQRATDGEPARFRFQEAMNRLNDHVTKDFLRKAQQDVVREHFRRWPG